MDLGIKGKTALVLGASQGIGAAITTRLAMEGANVVLASRNMDKLTALADTLSSAHGIEAQAYDIDMTDAGAVAGMCDKIRSDWKPDILLNNAGGPPPGTATGVSDDVWKDAIQSLLLSLIRVSEAALETMQERGWGRILTVASSGIIQPIPTLPISNTVRSAFVGFSKSLSNQVAGDGITVNIIVPGRIDTDRAKAIDNGVSEKQGLDIEEVRKRSRATIPMGRYGTPEEFADVAVFHMSDLAGYVTGSMIRVDGGAVKSI